MDTNRRTQIVRENVFADEHAIVMKERVGMNENEEDKLEEFCYPNGKQALEERC